MAIEITELVSGEVRAQILVSESTTPPWSQSSMALKMQKAVEWGTSSHCKAKTPTPGVLQLWARSYTQVS